MAKNLSIDEQIKQTINKEIKQLNLGEIKEGLVLLSERIIHIENVINGTNETIKSVKEKSMKAVNERFDNLIALYDKSFKNQMDKFKSEATKEICDISTSILKEQIVPFYEEVKSKIINSLRSTEFAKSIYEELTNLEKSLFEVQSKIIDLDVPLVKKTLWKLHEQIREMSNLGSEIS